KLASSFRMWLICAQQFLRAAAQVMFGTWFATLLKDNPNIEEEHIRWLASVPPVMLIIGSLCGGIIADWLLWRTGSPRISRQWFAVASLLVCAAMFFLATLTFDVYRQVSLVAVGCFFMATGGVGSYAITLDLGGRR